jgi:hypothetical protein
MSKMIKCDKCGKISDGVRPLLISETYDSYTAHIIHEYMSGDLMWKQDKLDLCPEHQIELDELIKKFMGKR